MPTTRFEGFAHAVVVAIALTIPGTAGAVATNLTLSTPTGPAVRTQVIVIDAGGDEVAREDTDDRGAVAFDLPDGSYRIRTRDGRESESFRVRGPGPLAIALPLGTGAAAATTTSSANPLGVQFDFEVGYDYWNGGASTQSNITGVALDTAHEKVDLDDHGVALMGRLHVPCETLGASVFLQAGGVATPGNRQHGARFGDPGATGLAMADLEYRGGAEIDAGARFAIPIGESEIGISPYGGFALEFYRAWLRFDETGVGSGSSSRDDGMQVNNLVFGANADFRPCRDGCGLYFFLGGGYKVPVGSRTLTLRDDTPGGFQGQARFKIDDGFFLRTGAGYRFGP